MDCLCVTWEKNNSCYQKPVNRDPFLWCFNMEWSWTWGMMHPTTKSTFSTKCPYANQVWALLWPTTQPFSILCLNFSRQGICPYAYLNLEFLILSQPLYHLGSQYNRPMTIFIFGDKCSDLLDMKDKHGYVRCGYLWDKSVISMWLRAWVYTDTNSV